MAETRRDREIMRTELLHHVTEAIAYLRENQPVYAYMCLMKCMEILKQARR